MIDEDEKIICTYQRLRFMFMVMSRRHGRGGF